MSNSSSLFSHRKIPYISISVNIGNFFIFSNLRIKAIDAQNISILENDKTDFSLFSREVMDICNDSLKKSDYISSRIFLDRLKGLSYKEIAQKYNMTGRQVTYEISKVLSILKDALKDYLPAFIILMSSSYSSLRFN